MKSIIQLFQSRMIYKFVATFTLLIILAIMGTSFSILALTRHAIIQNERKIFVRMASSLKTEVEKSIENNTQYLNQLKKNPNININNSLITGAFFYDAIRRNSAIKELMLLTPDHIKLVGSDMYMINAKASTITKQPYDLAIIKNKKIQNHTTIEKDLLFISIPILNREETEYIYSLGAFFNLSQLTSTIEQLQKSSQLQIDIINSQFVGTNYWWEN